MMQNFFMSFLFFLVLVNQAAYAKPNTEDKHWQIMPQLGHTGGIQALAFSADGLHFITGGIDHTIRLWETRTGRLLRIMRGHSLFVTTVAFSPDGKLIASGSTDNTIRLWDSKTGKLLHTIKAHTDGVSHLDFSPDGKSIVSVSSDGTMYLWNSKTGQKRLPFMAAEEGDPILSVAFSPDGKTIIAGAGGDKIYSLKPFSVRLVDSQTGKVFKELEGHKSSVNSVAFSPDGTLIASSSYDKTVRLWNSKTGQIIHSLKHKTSANSVRFSPDGKMLIVSLGGIGDKEPQAVVVWDSLSGKRLMMLTGHKKSVNDAIFSPDGKIIISASNDLQWNTTSGKFLRQVKSFNDDIDSFQLSSDGKRFVILTTKKNIIGLNGTIQRLWDAETGKLLGSFKKDPKALVFAKFSPDSSKIALATDDKKVVLVLSAKNGKLLSLLKGHTQKISALLFSPDSSKVITSSWDKTIRVWDSRTGKLLHILKGHGFWIEAMQYSRDKKQLVSITTLGEVISWDAKKWQKIKMGGKFPSQKSVSKGSNLNSIWGAMIPFPEKLSSDKKHRFRWSGSFVDKIDENTHKVLRTFTSLPNGEWVSYTSDGNYVASAHANEYLLLVEQSSYNSKKAERVSK